MKSGAGNFLIIGYGNPLRSDDGIGYRAAQLLEEALAGEKVEVLACHQLTPELALAVARAERVVLIDACAQGEPGEVHCRELAPTQASSAFSHRVDARMLLAMAHMLYDAAPPTSIFTMSGESFAFGEGLSPGVAAELPKLVARIVQLAASSHRRAFKT